MKLVLILRGVAGSGKTTEAQRWLKRSPSAVIVSADPFMGIQFDFRKLDWCHQMSLASFRDALGSHDLIIVDNTNTRVSEMRSYVSLAREAGYDVLILQLNVDPRLGASRTLHSVPLDTVERQAKRLWSEPLPADWEVWQRGRPWRPPFPERRPQEPESRMRPPARSVPKKASPTVEYRRVRASSES